ncbi:MAG: S41 family peptidase [Leptospiraceae bacterium]|nr:S41 family peptidase [Leptospiraceae bacterium]MCK6381935.1 S41 family peptidase [Leptospiraceae bacterium]NUM42282.1 S41 family peptidase [Leptospiraceae bacterium]
MKFLKLFSVSIFLILSLTINCESKAKKSPRSYDFTSRDFETVVSTVEKQYIEKNIHVDRAYTDAAIFALMSLPHALFLYPESYFKDRAKYEEVEEIFPGETFKISPSDRFVIFNPDYTKVEELRKKKYQAESSKPKIQNDELKKMMEREQIKKSILASRWEQIHFSKKDFDRVIAFVQDNISKYRESPFKDPMFEVDEEADKKSEFGMKDVYLAAANGYLNSLDPHSSVFLKEMWEESMAKIQDSTFEGIGAILSGGGPREVIIENPLEGRPAVKAGIRSGDVILAVDGKAVKGLSLDKVVKRIKGKKGTKVVLTLKRKGSTQLFNIEVERATIEMKNVTKNLIKDHEHIGYIKLTGFVKSNTESSDRDIKNAYNELEKEAAKKNIKLKALVLDLRNNAGGYLDLAIDISDMFLSKGVIVSTGRDQGTEEARAEPNNEITNLPMVVLINAKSASASEIVASALQHHGRALLLGERTFGKATVQKLIDPLPGNRDFVLKLTQSRYYDPSGMTIQVVGVNPDIEVSAEEDGSFPFQYREENMWAHLPKIESDKKHKTYFNLEKLKDWVKKKGMSESFLQKHKNDPIKPDYQLIRSLDYIEALIAVK